MSYPRVRPEKGKTQVCRIDFRYVIDSLAKKPGASYRVTLKNNTLPDDKWRRPWCRLCNHLEPDIAGRLMTYALRLAVGYDDVSVAAKDMEQVLNVPGNVDLHRLMRFSGIKEGASPIVDVKQYNLNSYEQLPRGKGGSQ